MPKGPNKGSIIITVSGIVRNATRMKTIHLSDHCQISPDLRDQSGRVIRGIYPPITPPRPPRTCTALAPGRSRVVATWVYRSATRSARQGYWSWDLRRYSGRRLGLRLSLHASGDCSQSPPARAGRLIFSGSLRSGAAVVRLPSR